ncbi:starch-binding protein [Anaerosporobacter sp.]
MKKNLEKVLSFVLVFAFVIIGCALPSKLAKAADATDTSSDAGNVVKVYYYDENSWGSVNIWSWTVETTKDLAKNAWPGDPMTDEGDGWFSAEITSDESIGVLFTNNSGAQTADCKDLEPGKTYWLTNGSQNLLNDSGMGGGVNVVASTEPQAGWPEGPEAETTSAPAVANEDSDSNNVVLYVVIAVVVVVVVIAGVVIISKRKKGKE